MTRAKAPTDAKKRKTPASYRRSSKVSTSAEIANPKGNPVHDHLLDICDRVSSGEHLTDICRDLKVNQGSFFKELKKSPELYQHYLDARANQAESLVLDVHKLAKSRVATPVEHQEKKLEIETTKWLVEKLLPKVYGQRLALTGPDGGAITLQAYREKLEEAKKAIGDK